MKSNEMRAYEIERPKESERGELGSEENLKRVCTFNKKLTKPTNNE